MRGSLLPLNSKPGQKMPEIEMSQEHPKLKMGGEFHVKHAHKYVFVYLFIVLLLGTTGAVYTWQHKKISMARAHNANLRAKIDDLNQKLDTMQQTATQAIVPDASWKTFCDTRHSECFKYPADWILQNSSNAQLPYTAVMLMNQPKSVTVNYTNTIAKDGFSTRFHSNIVTELAHPIPGLKVVGGYTYGSTQYTLTIGVVDASSTPKNGQVSQVDIPQVFTDKDKATVQFSASPSGGTNEISEAHRWFNTSDAQIALAILRTLYYK